MNRLIYVVIYFNLVALTSLVQEFIFFTHLFWTEIIDYGNSNRFTDYKDDHNGDMYITICIIFPTKWQ